MLPAALAPILAATGPVGWAAAGIGALGSIVMGVNKNNAAKARARALEMQALQKRQETGIEAQLGLVDDERLAAQAAVTAGANGGGFTGSVADVMQDLANQSLMKARLTVYRGETQARNNLQDAAVARREGKNALIEGGFQAANSVLSTLSNNYQARLPTFSGRR